MSQIAQKIRVVLRIGVVEVVSTRIITLILSLVRR